MKKKKVSDLDHLDLAFLRLLRVLFRHIDEDARVHVRFLDPVHFEDLYLDIYSLHCLMNHIAHIPKHAVVYGMKKSEVSGHDS